MTTTIATTLASDIATHVIPAQGTRGVRTAVSFTAKVEREDGAGHPRVVTACFIDELDGGLEALDASFYGTALVGDSVIIDAVELHPGNSQHHADNHPARETMPLYRVLRITDPYADEIDEGL